MTDSDREKREWTIWVCKDCGQLAHGPGSRCAKDRRRTWTQMTDVVVVPLERAQELERERDEARALLRRLDEWDQICSTAPGCDGPYWRREIAAVLDPSFLPPDREE